MLCSSYIWLGDVPNPGIQFFMRGWKCLRNVLRETRVGGREPSKRHFDSPDHREREDARVDPVVPTAHSDPPRRSEHESIELDSAPPVDPATVPLSYSAHVKLPKLAQEVQWGANKVDNLLGHI